MQSEDRIEKLLALLLLHQMKGSPNRDKALQLNLAGFTNTEIADLLQIKATGVAVALYEARQKKSKK
ncbi:MAG TPA: hypothetical protein VNL73_06540 [Verrucomicrobiae bacterium]|nr:hypothetical protein [Verrucomicrobiae bacterium]